MLKRFFLKLRIAGISLMELLFALSVVAAFMMTATKYYSEAQTVRKIEVTIENIQMIRTAIDHGSLMGTQPRSIDELVSTALLPSKFKDDANPWAGKGGIVDGTITEFDFAVKFLSIPQKACKNLISKFTKIENITVDCPSQITGDMVVHIIR